MCESAANALGRVGAFASPYLVRTTTPITTVGAIMLVVNLVTAFSAWQLPETKGHFIGHTSLEDTNNEGGEVEVSGALDTSNQARVPPIV